MAALKKIIKNTTGSDIEINETGQTVPAGGQIEIDPINYNYWATSETITEITSAVNAGDLVINNGTSDLNAADGLLFLEHPDRAIVQLSAADVVRVAKILNFQGDVDVSQPIAGQATITIGETGTATGKLYVITGFAPGVTINKWVSVEHPNATSDMVPFDMPGDGRTIALTYSNENDASNADIEFYVNAVLKFTWQIRNKRTAFKVVNIGMFTVVQGDRISIFAKAFSGPGPMGFDDADVNVSTDTINIINHGYSVGLEVELETETALPAPLATGTDYFIIVVDANNIKIAASLADAIAGTPIDITSATGGDDHTVKPKAINPPKDPVINMSVIITNLPDGDGGQENGD